MKIVLLCTTYSLDSDNPTLADEMAEAYVRHGHDVTVFVVNWSRKRLGVPVSAQKERLSVYMVDPVKLDFGPSLFRKIAKWMLSSASVLGRVLKYRKDHKADIVIGFSPAIAMFLPIIAMTAFSRARKFLVQWDFFPDHHAQIGLLSGRMLVRMLKWIETALMRRFEVIGCMSPRNISYLSRNYNLSSHQRIVELPIWSSFPNVELAGREQVRKEFGLPLDAMVLVFGGQLSKGRGIEDILEVAALSAAEGLECLFLFVGNGEQEGALKSAIASGAANVMHLGGVTRKKYLSLLSACDIGIVSTVRGVSVPTFPSKTLDYINIGLPVIASVESATDYGDFVRDSGIGLPVTAGDMKQFVAAIKIMATSDSTAPWKNPVSFARAKEQFLVDGVSNRLIDLVGAN